MSVSLISHCNEDDLKGRPAVYICQFVSTLFTVNSFYWLFEQLLWDPVGTKTIKVLGVCLSTWYNF